MPSRENLYKIYIAEYKYYKKIYSVIYIVFIGFYRNEWYIYEMSYIYILFSEYTTTNSSNISSSSSSSTTYNTTTTTNTIK